MRRQHSSARVESALRRNLLRQPVPAGFTARVMAEIREETRRKPAKSVFPFPKLSWRTGFALAGSACVAFLLLTADRPFGREDRSTEQVALNGAARDLAEALQLAGNKWNQAREAAFAPRLDK